MSDPMWSPDPTRAAQSQIARFAAWAHERHGAPPDPLDYAALWRWSVEDLEGFWSAVWNWFDVMADGSPTVVLADERMPGARWFPDVSLSYAEHVLRHADRGENTPAIITVAEDGTDVVLGWRELHRQVAAAAFTLRRLGVRSGDRVVGYLPHTAEAVVAFLATASLGAVWSVVGQDYAARAVVDRFAQLEPVVLVTADGYRFGGRAHDRRDAVAEIHRGLPTVRGVIAVERLGLSIEDAVPWHETTAGDHDLEITRVPFDHPLWVLFSSGTTGLPKGIVHGHGGVLLEHLKSLALQLDLRAGERYFWFTTPSWMMWNYLVSGLLLGATIVCYDGSPTADDSDRLWALAERYGVAVLGVSPAYLQGSSRSGLRPAATHDLSGLRALGVTGSVLPPTSDDWVAEQVGRDVQLMSVTGGTDVVTTFAGGAPTAAVHRGEIAARCLGVSLESWDDAGRSVVGRVGELVVTRPIPSMPVGFWNDPDGSRYHDAYFGTFPGVWRHGDWVTVTDRGSIVIHGRSDATLNRHGIRLGSADIYQVVESRDDVLEALVIGAELPDGSYWMPLFVVLAEGRILTEDLDAKIRAEIRAELSPRHVPDDVIQVPGLPHTRNGKKLEVPVKRLLQGMQLRDVVNPGSVDRPELFDVFVSLAAERRTRA